MNQLNPLYQSEAKCPVCENKIEITKVRSRQIKLIRQDTDFCPHYSGVNPLYYEAVVCPLCGFASHISDIDHINRYEKKKVMDLITKKWVPRRFTGERTWEKALEAFKLVLLNLNCREAVQSDIAKTCLRIAWLYRYAGDAELEKRYLTHALNAYKKSYETENLAEGKLEDYTCVFIIAELSRRIGNAEDSMLWFSRLIGMYSDPKNKVRIPQKLIETTRDLVHELKGEDRKTEAM